MSDMGLIVNSHTVRFERMLPAPIDTAWQYLTDPQSLKKWLMEGCVNDGRGLIEFTSDVADPDGVLHRVTGVLAECKPPHELSYSWFEPSQDTSSHVRFHLEPRGEETLLILTHTLLAPKLMPLVGAGWHTHLDQLISVIQGNDSTDFGPQFSDLLTKYGTALAAAGIIATSSGSPAIAQSTDAAHQSLNIERTRLLSEYDRTWKDADDLKREINSLKRISSQDVNKGLDDLDRDLKNKLNDLRTIELDIRDLDKALVLTR